MNADKTIFCDIDGTLVKHVPPDESALPSFKMTLLPNAMENLLDWNRKNYTIILTTGRKESQREITIKQLQEVGIFYDHLIMGLGRGTRVIINDKKIDGENTAMSINLERNKGFANINL